MSTVDVTVVMPARDRAELIGRALDSIAAQSVVPREVIVIDDGSLDDTAAVAAARGATVIRLEESGGSGPARNQGIRAATTTWIAFLDSDDEWHEGHLQYLMANTDGRALVAAPGRAEGRIMGNSWGRDRDLRPIDLLAPGDLVCTSGVAVRRDALVAGGLFRPLRRAQDLDMWLRVLDGGSGLALAAPTFTYHLHGAQAINDKDLMRECYDRIVADCRGRSWFAAGDHDRAYVRFRWDELRVAQRGRDLRRTARLLRWFAARPHTAPTLGRLLRQRRLSRTARV